MPINGSAEPNEPVPSSDTPAAPKRSPPPWSIKFAVWFDWAVAFLLGGLAVGEFWRDLTSTRELCAFGISSSLLLGIGEGLRRRSRWGWFLHLLASVVLAIPGILALLLALKGKAGAGDVGGQEALILLVALGGAVQIPLALARATREWMKDASAARPSHRALLLAAIPVFAAALVFQAVLFLRGWSWHSFPEIGIRVRMPNMVSATVERRRDELGVAYDVHFVDGLERGSCRYSVSYASLPEEAAGRKQVPAAHRSTVIERVAKSAEGVSRRPVVAKGSAKVEGEEVRFRRGGVPWQARVFAPLPRVIVLQAFCTDGTEPRNADVFLQSLTVDPR